MLGAGCAISLRFLALLGMTFQVRLLQSLCSFAMTIGEGAGSFAMMLYSAIATSSISTLAPNGRVATPTVERAGLTCPRYSA